MTKNKLLALIFSITLIAALVSVVVIVYFDGGLSFMFLLVAVLLWGFILGGYHAYLDALQSFGDAQERHERGE